MAKESWLNPNLKIKLNEFKKIAPFSHAVINDFLKPEKIIEILRALDEEKFYEKNSDLFSFLQTNDFINTKNKMLKKLRSEFMNEKTREFIENSTGLKVSDKKFDMSAAIYRNKDYLLCHDDRVEKRKVAYIFYLTTLKDNQGGALNLFSSKNNEPYEIGKKIIPKSNTLVLFEVSQKSFHEVEEVIGNGERIAVGGWFYDGK